MQSICCKNVNKVFSSGETAMTALHNINLEIYPGEFLAIVGASGSGKSTLLSILGTLEHPTSGEVLYGDKPINQLKNNQIADFRFNNVGFVFQQFHLLPSLTALENVMAPLVDRKVNFNKKKRAESVLHEVGLEEKLNELPQNLSGGQQQRVAIARAIVNDPEWILADEPTGNLDTNTSEKIIDILINLNKNHGRGLILVTHDVNLAKRANRVITIKDGQID